MKLNISHSEKKSLEVAKETIDAGSTIYRSPHIGNLNNDELSLVFGLDAIGSRTQLELVDTIRGSDTYSTPRVAIAGMSRVILASSKQARRIVGSCKVRPEGIKELEGLGVSMDPIDETQGLTLKELHLGSLKQALPESVEAGLSSEFFAQIGEHAYEIVLREASNIIDRPLRAVDSSGRIEEAQGVVCADNIYGLGDRPREGLLPPLEAMMAIEVVKKVIENGASDDQIVHVAGADMIRYTKIDEVMEPVKNIVERALSDLGIPGNTTFDYRVLCRAAILGSADFDPIISEDIRSQYDLLLARRGVEVCYE